MYGKSVSREVAEGILIDGFIRSSADVPSGCQAKHTADHGTAC